MVFIMKVIKVILIHDFDTCVTTLVDKQTGGDINE